MPIKRRGPKKKSYHKVRKNDGKLKCKVCGKRLREIGASHLRTHGLTVDEYKKKYKGARTIGLYKRMMMARFIRIHEKKGEKEKEKE